jgi:hypothetical protein
MALRFFFGYGFLGANDWVKALHFDWLPKKYRYTHFRLIFSKDLPIHSV